MNAVWMNNHYSVQKSNGRNDLVRGDVERNWVGSSNNVKKEICKEARIRAPSQGSTLMFV